MTAFNPITLNDLNEILRNSRQANDVTIDLLVESSFALQTNNPFTTDENSASEHNFNVNSNRLSGLIPGPGDEDDDDDDDDDLLDDDTLMPMEDDEDEDSLLSADDDVIPGTDMDDEDDLDEDDMG